VRARARRARATRASRRRLRRELAIVRHEELGHPAEVSLARGGLARVPSHRAAMRRAHGVAELLLRHVESDASLAEDRVEVASRLPGHGGRRHGTQARDDGKCLARPGQWKRAHGKSVAVQWPIRRATRHMDARQRRTGPPTMCRYRQGTCLRRCGVCLHRVRESHRRASKCQGRERRVFAPGDRHTGRARVCRLARAKHTRRVRRCLGEWRTCLLRLRMCLRREPQVPGRAALCLFQQSAHRHSTAMLPSAEGVRVTRHP
jgi:hypothetical protein